MSTKKFKLTMEAPSDNLESETILPVSNNPADKYPLNKNGFGNQNQTVADSGVSKSEKICEVPNLPKSMPTSSFPGYRFVLTLDGDEGNAKSQSGWVWEEDRFVEYDIPVEDLPVYKCSYCQGSFRGSGALSKHLRSHNLNGSTISRGTLGAAESRSDVAKKPQNDQSNSEQERVLASSGNEGLQIKVNPRNTKRKKVPTKPVKSGEPINPVPSPPESNKLGTGTAGINANIEEIVKKEKKEFRCKLCGRLFSIHCNAQRHIKVVHLKEKQHRSRCSICSKTFSDKQYLKIHMNYHTGFKPHRCNLCPAAFVQKGHLKLHLLVHSGTKAHKCNLCDKEFFQRFLLTNHLRSHESVKGKAENKEIGDQAKCSPPESDQ